MSLSKISVVDRPLTSSSKSSLTTGMGVPYMGYPPDGMMGPIAMPMGGMAPSLPAPGGGSGCPTGQSAQRNDLVTKAKLQSFDKHVRR